MQNKILIKEQSREAETVTKNVMEKLGFRLFFLGSKDEDVQVVEVEEIDFDDVRRRLESGKSIFMAGICQRKCNPRQTSG